MWSKWEKIISITVGVVIAMAGNTFAAGSGGYRVELPDAEAFGKGTAFVGEANNPAAIYYNPAGLTQIKGKNHLSAGFSVLAPSVKYTDFAGNESQMVRQNFLIPHLYLVSDFGLDDFVFGLGGMSSWGTGTAWADDSFAKYVATESDVKNLDTMITGAFKANDQWSFALSVDNDYSVANKSKKLWQPGFADGDFNLKGKASGWGYRLATLFKLNERHQFGLMYRSSIQEKYRGKVYLHGLNAAPATNYLAKFGASEWETKIAVQSELPQSAVLGYSFQPDNKWTFNFDVEWMDWSSIEQEWIEFTEVLTEDQSAVLNNGNPASRDWRDVWSACFGVEYGLSERLKLRGGYYYHTTPIPEENWEPNLPDANSHGVTAGFGYDLTENSAIDMAYSAFIFEDRTIDNEVGSGSNATIDGEYEQVTHMGLVTFSYKF
ncbi:MAG: outer membrane protein transport protein [Candidatus Omnitrophica bacterium]|nr:outer membrane protein transport protein [Candidatus Omnitrophota bacterium]